MVGNSAFDRSVRQRVRTSAHVDLSEDELCSFSCHLSMLSFSCPSPSACHNFRLGEPQSTLLYLEWTCKPARHAIVFIQHFPLPFLYHLFLCINIFLPLFYLQYPTYIRPASLYLMASFVCLPYSTFLTFFSFPLFGLFSFFFPGLLVRWTRPPFFFFWRSLSDS